MLQSGQSLYNVPAWRLYSLLGITLLQNLLCWGQNLADNPGFETGNTSGWSMFGSGASSAQSTIVHSGNYAALVQGRTETWNGIAQSLLGKVIPGQNCNISAWVRITTGSQNVQVTVRKTENGTPTYGVIGAGSVSSTGWTQFSGQYAFTASGDVTELTVYIEVPSSATASYYVDDLVVQVSGGTGPSGTDGESLVQWEDVYQRIDGFGASSAWRGNWTAAQADMFFSTNSGIGVAKSGGTFPFVGVGLSLLRSRIAPGATTVEQTIMQMAQARGAAVWSAPWSPATQFKSNGNVNGGSFVGNPANYAAYASQLAGYVARMKTQYGVNLYALSVQNEPDADVTSYESCNWTSQQLHDFIPYLSSALAASNVAATKIMLPESQNWTDPQGLRIAAMNDPAVASLVGIIANHNYVMNNDTGDQAPPAAIQNYEKALWETEVAKLSGSDSSIDDGIYWAGRVHQFLTLAQANAWHYWWLIGYGSGNQGLCDTNEVPAKRMYTVGNFSRFVRPGFNRIGVTGTGTAWVSAYRSPTNGGFAIVAINQATNAVVQTFSLDGFSCSSVSPWLTSASLSLASQSAVGVTNGQFSYSIPAKSVVTFAGIAIPPNSAPSFSPVADVTTGAGVQLAITNAASDSDLPQQALLFALLTGPTNATLNATNGVLKWRPLVAQADSTNLVRVKVTDNGTPALSATNAYTIVVVPLEQPTVGMPTPAPTQTTVSVTGALGPDYILLASTNLINWQTISSTNPVSMPVTLVDTNQGYPVRFYRIQLAP